MKSILFALAALFCTASAALPPNFSNCGDDVNDGLLLKNVSFSNMSPAPGETIFVTVSGRAQKTLLKGAQVKITAKLGVLVVKTDYLDSCVLAQENGLSCPVDPKQFGDRDLTYVVKYVVPQDVPKGVVFVLRVVGINGDGNGNPDPNFPVSCYTGPMKISG